MESLRLQLSEMKEQTEGLEMRNTEMMENAEREKQEMEERHNEAMEEMKEQMQRQKILVVRLGKENRTLKQVIEDAPEDKEGCFVFKWFQK